VVIVGGEHSELFVQVFPILLMMTRNVVIKFVFKIEKQDKNETEKNSHFPFEENQMIEFSFISFLFFLN
jgi:hypothetical protein